MKEMVKSKTTLALHANELNHDVKWDEVKVLYRGNHTFKKRFWSVFILTKIKKKIENGDVGNLYANILNIMK